MHHWFILLFSSLPSCRFLFIAFLSIMILSWSYHFVLDADLTRAYMTWSAFGGLFPTQLTNPNLTNCYIRVLRGFFLVAPPLLGNWVNCGRVKSMVDIWYFKVWVRYLPIIFLFSSCLLCPFSPLVDVSSWCVYVLFFLLFLLLLLLNIWSRGWTEYHQFISS